MKLFVREAIKLAHYENNESAQLIAKRYGLPLGVIEMILREGRPNTRPVLTVIDGGKSNE